MAATTLSEDWEQQQQLSSNQHRTEATQAGQVAVPAVRPDWRNRGGVDRIRSYSAAATHQAIFHNSALLFKALTQEIAGMEDSAEQVTRVYPGAAPHLAEIEDMVVQSWKCSMAQYLNRGRP
jgi:hypothetical protein